VFQRVKRLLKGLTKSSRIKSSHALQLNWKRIYNLNKKLRGILKICICFSKPPAFATINAPLKSVTASDPVAGFKVDLSGQVSKHFQVGGTWQYNKQGGAFSLNTALMADTMVQDANFVAGTYHDNGKLESRGLLGLGYGFSVGGEAMFTGPDVRRSYYAVELAKAFDYCTAGFKWGNGMRSFSYMQTLTNNLCGGFECTYIVF